MHDERFSTLIHIVIFNIVVFRIFEIQAKNEIIKQNNEQKIVETKMDEKSTEVLCTRWDGLIGLLSEARCPTISLQARHRGRARRDLL